MERKITASKTDRKITTRESILLGRVGLGECNLKSPLLTDNFYEDLIELCRQHFIRSCTEKRIDYLEEQVAQLHRKLAGDV